MILLDSFVKVGKRYYQQTFLKECKYSVKKIKNVISEKLDLEESVDDYDGFDKSDDENNVE